MKKIGLKYIAILLSITVLPFYGCNIKSNKVFSSNVSNLASNSGENTMEVNEDKNSMYFYAENKGDLQSTDFNNVYEMCRALLTEYYYTKSNKANIDFSRYISNNNLLEYSKRKLLQEGNNLTIKDISFGVSKVEFYTKGYFYLKLIAEVRGDNNSEFAEVTEFLVEGFDGRLVISDWYTQNGTVSYYDQLIREENSIELIDVWENEGFVSRIFSKAGISKDKIKE